jgi:3-dehydroquinate dehydratase type I
MMLFATILEPDAQSAIRAIGELQLDHDGVEVRVELFDAYDPAALRAATRKPMILTRRGAGISEREIEAAFAAGIDWVDVEHGRALPAKHRERLVLSHHDYAGMPDVVSLAAEMRATGCGHVKIAVTPKSFPDNQKLLSVSGPRTSIIGMGERGLYSRILAPFLGSELAFAGNAAPGQLALEQALQIYGPDRRTLRAGRIFAIAGNPAGHSRSPLIHNRLFREKGVPGAYTIASVETFDEIVPAFQSGEISGLSVTAPFKEDAFRFAERAGLQIGPNAREAGAVNTLVRGIADNTDVDGFETILRQVCGRDRKTAAVLGAGGTARAALVALRRAGVTAVPFHRANLADIRAFDGEIIINTLPPGVAVDLPLRPGMAYIKAAYGEPAGEYPGVDYRDGVELLHAQAVRQHELFMRVFDGS